MYSPSLVPRPSLYTEGLGTRLCTVLGLRREGGGGVGLRCGGVLDAVDVLIACAHKELEMSVLCQASIHQQRVGEEGVEGREEVRQLKV